MDEYHLQNMFVEILLRSQVNTIGIAELQYLRMERALGQAHS